MLPLSPVLFVRQQGAHICLMAFACSMALFLSGSCRPPIPDLCRRIGQRRSLSSYPYQAASDGNPIIRKTRSALSGAVRCIGPLQPAPFRNLLPAVYNAIALRMAAIPALANLPKRSMIQTMSKAPETLLVDGRFVSWRPASSKRAIGERLWESSLRSD